MTIKFPNTKKTKWSVRHNCYMRDRECKICYDITLIDKIENSFLFTTTINQDLPFIELTN